MNTEEKIAEIEINISRMNEKLDKILFLLEKDCKKMSDHIDFVDEIYDNIKHPLHFIMNKTSNLIRLNSSNEIGRRSLTKENNTIQ